MRNFKKAYNLKIVSVLVAITFLVTSTVYGIDFTNRSHLRPPVSNNSERLKNIISYFDQQEKIDGGDSKQIESATQEAKEKVRPNSVTTESNARAADITILVWLWNNTFGRLFKRAGYESISNIIRVLIVTPLTEQFLFRSINSTWLSSILENNPLWFAGSIFILTIAFGFLHWDRFVKISVGSPSENKKIQFSFSAFKTLLPIMGVGFISLGVGTIGYALGLELLPILFAGHLIFNAIRLIPSGYRSGRVVRNITYKGTIPVVSSFIGAILLLHWVFVLIGGGFSVKHAFKLPIPTGQLAQGFKRQGPKLGNSHRIITLQEMINDKLTTGTADRIFWTDLFSSYPNTQSVSAIVTIELIHQLYDKGQLDHLFNGLRSYPDVLYRYLSEIPIIDHQEFARYFATLKPGTRQQVFEILYKRLRNDMLILENAEEVKALVFSGAFEKLSVQTNNLEELYAAMVQALNRTMPLATGELIDEPVAPQPLIAFTKDRAIDILSTGFHDVIQDYVDRGYTVTLPAPDMVNISSLAGLIGHYVDYADTDFRSIVFLEENQSAKLLKWVLEQTDSNSPHGHRLNELEILKQAMELHANPEEKTVNLFRAVADCGHFFKAMARHPDLILGGPEARLTEDGTDFIWRIIDPMFLVASLDPLAKFSVDVYGRPVYFSRPVDDDGNELIPNGQKTGILRFGTEDEMYHSWNFFFTALYVDAKTLEEIKTDLKYVSQHYWSISRLHNTTPWEFVTSGISKAIDPNPWGLGTPDTTRLPISYKYARQLGIGNISMMSIPFGFGKKRGGSEERAKLIMSEVASYVYRNLVIEQGLVKLVDQPEVLVNNKSLRLIEGGMKAMDYSADLIAEWKNLGEPHWTEWALKDPKRFYQVAIAIEQLSEMRYRLKISMDIPRYEIVRGALEDGRLNIEDFGYYGPIEWQKKIAVERETPSWLLKSLLSIPTIDLGVREVIASNSNTPADALRELALDFNAKVRTKVAGNRSTPAETLGLLSLDPSPIVRAKCAFNPMTPPESLIVLTTDEDVKVIESVAENPSTPTKVLEPLITGTVEVRRSLARNIASSQKLLDTLSADKDPMIRRLSAVNPSASIETIKKFASDSDVIVRTNVTYNPNISPELLAQLSTDSEDKVRKAVAHSDHAAVATLINLLDKEDVSEVKGAVKNELEYQRGYIGKHALKIYKAWVETTKNWTIQEDVIDALFEAEHLFQKAMEVFPEETWEEVEITGNIREDIEAWIEAIREFFVLSTSEREGLLNSTLVFSRDVQQSI